MVSEKALEWIQEIKGHCSSAGETAGFTPVGQDQWRGVYGREKGGGVRSTWWWVDVGGEGEEVSRMTSWFLAWATSWAVVPHSETRALKITSLLMLHIFPSQFSGASIQTLCATVYRTVSKAPPQFQHIQDKTHFLQLFCLHSGVDSWGKIAPLSQPRSQKQWAILDFILSSLGNSWVLGIPPR